jgi:acetyltransferase-like isoleucine patch superfamily enzyme
MTTLLRALLVLLPWPLRRPLLARLYGYRLASGSHIGLAWVFPRELVLERGARIGHFTVVKGLERLALGEHALIGRLNWISAFPVGTGSKHFAHLAERKPELVVAEHAAITNRHIIDCTERVSVGKFATVAGFRSQILTHSIDLTRCRQDAKPVTIGEYCFVGTACTILGGAALPSYSVLGAHSLLNKVLTEPYRLYGGVPAVAVGKLDACLEYFRRAEGFVT